jgi:hypothetical protein
MTRGGETTPGIVKHADAETGDSIAVEDREFAFPAAIPSGKRSNRVRRKVLAGPVIASSQMTSTYEAELRGCRSRNITAIVAR